MSEAEVVQRTPFARTTDSLRADLERLGLPREVRCWCTVVERAGLGQRRRRRRHPRVARATGSQAALVMPAHSATAPTVGLATPTCAARVVADDRETMPVFDPRLTPTRGLGRIAELFRTWPGVVRSTHPAYSFCALGPMAETITANHSLDFGLGENSPLGRLYEHGASVLFLGVGYDSNTCFHLAEYRIPNPRLVEEGSPAMEGTQHVWRARREVELNSDVFAELGEAFERTSRVRLGAVGSAQARLFAVREAVDFAVEWLSKRAASGSPQSTQQPLRLP
jgi:aminoglycoside 3-N-acetyltransferase